MAEIFCIRHGQASFGTSDYDQLSDLGYRQGELLGKYFVKSGISFDTLHAGTLKRQQQTAQAVVDVYQRSGINAPEIQIDPRWNELQSEEQVTLLAPYAVAADPSLKPLLSAAATDKKAFQKLIRATFDFWIENPDVEAQSLETWQAAQQRVLDVLGQVQSENGRGNKAAVFSSGGIIAIITAHLLSLPAKGVYPLFEKVINCSISRVMHNSENIALSTFNEHAYLSAIAPNDEQASIITYR